MKPEIVIPEEYSRLLDDDWREAAVYGGRYSLKSHTVARILLIKAYEKKRRFLCAREFQNSIADSSLQLLADLIKQYKLDAFVVTRDSIINKQNGSDFLFKGLHNNVQSIKSIEGVDYCWVEEAQTISEESLEILTPTIRKPGSKLIYTYNRLREEDPIHKRLVIEGRPNTLIINCNYDIAIKYGWINTETIEEIEDDKKNRPKLYRYKWLGEPNVLEGRIYNDWLKIDSIPHEARLERYGLDFGYTNDPTAIVAIYYYNGGYVIDEVTYQKGLSNKQIADILNNQPKALVMADSAEPKSIDELKLYGVNVLPCVKGHDSVNQGIQYVQDQQISYTAHSTYLEKEYKNYMWDVDKEGRVTNKPDGTNDHAMDACFSPDSLVSTIDGDIPIKYLVGKSGYLYSRGGKIRRYSDVRVTRTNADVLTLYFDDGNKLTITPDHRLLLPNGEWKEAGLLNKLDVIQSVTYEYDSNRQQQTKFQWNNILQVWKLLFKLKTENQTITQGYLDIPLWTNTKGLSHTPQRYEQIKQLSKQLRTKTNPLSFKRTHYGGTSGSDEKTGGYYKTTYKGVARITRRFRMAQVTWYRNIQKAKTYIKRVCLLPQTIRNDSILRNSTILPPELQNESKTKTITRITRGFCPEVYNLEVEDTNCLLVNGVIAHNCRYGFESLKPKKEHKPQHRPPKLRFHL